MPRRHDHAHSRSTRVPRASPTLTTMPKITGPFAVRGTLLRGFIARFIARFTTRFTALHCPCRVRAIVRINSINASGFTGFTR